MNKNQSRSDRFRLPSLVIGGLSLVTVICPCQSVFAAQSDIVPVSSTLRDDLALLSTDKLIDEPASLLLQDPTYTRSELARILKDQLLNNVKRMDAVSGADRAALRDALTDLRPELKTDGVNIADRTASPTIAPLLGVEPQLRVRTGGDSKPGTGVIGLYRATATGSVNNSVGYGVSLSNWAEDNRRVFDNDIGAHDFSSVTNAYVTLAGRHDFTATIGRFSNNWGSGVSGSTLVSDNAPPLNQIQIAFPFSFGSRLGRNWDYTQFSSLYGEDSQEKYLQGRRINYTFNSRWTAQYEEAIKSTRSGSLLFAPIPYLIGKGIALGQIEQHSEFLANLGTTYQANQDLRAYGQFLLNDIKSPFSGRILGLSLGEGGSTPRRIGYLVGTTLGRPSTTQATFEYSYTDPTTYLDKNPEDPWTAGRYNYVGLPGGSESSTFYGRLGHRIAPSLTLSLAGRDRMRSHDSYPAPKATEVQAEAEYELNRRNSVRLTYYDYRQDAFPGQPGAAGYPSGDGFIPVSIANPGETLRVQQLDISYLFLF